MKVSTQERMWAAAMGGGELLFFFPGKLFFNLSQGKLEQWRHLDIAGCLVRGTCHTALTILTGVLELTGKPSCPLEQRPATKNKTSDYCRCKFCHLQ
jgi:hypothetical protein